MAPVSGALGPWGLLPVAAPLFAFVVARLGALAFPGERARLSDRAVAGIVLGFAAVVVVVRSLAVVHAVARAPLFLALVGASILLGVFRRSGRFRWPAVRLDASVIPACLVAASALAYAVLAALWLPVWQWDSLGYHLPFVHFTLAAGGVDGVPRELEYIGSYPHDVELFFVALRACLPDDRLVDLGQLPFGMAGAVVTAALARQWKASREGAVLAGVCWLVVPAVFLQLPTNYVDVATACFALAAVYFVLESPSGRALILGSVALGLLVGSKPSAPIPAVLLFLLLALRHARAADARLAVLAGLVILLLGGESYADNLVHHANPIWPVRLDLGPLHLPGTHPLTELLAAGANAPHITGPLPLRVLRSWLSLGSPPAFDMRVGGFGPLFLCALPFAFAWAVRQKNPVVWLALASALLSPDPAIARYVLAFPALVFAAAAPSVVTLASLRARALRGSGDSNGRGALFAVSLAVSVLGAIQLVYAAPGLCGEGPPLLAYATMSDAARAVAVGADGLPLAIAEARLRVGPGEAFGFDENMDLCDLAWDSAQSYRVVLLPSSSAGSPAVIGKALEDERVRVLAVGDTAPLGAWAASHPLQFERLSALPSCRKGTCSLFARR